MRESSIVRTVSAYLSARRFEVAIEYPFLQRHVDIVGFDRGRNKVVAVEAKVSNWQRAISQAVSCLLFADEVYIAMPAIFAHRVDRTELRRFGIGLLEVRSEVSIDVAAVGLGHTFQYHRDSIIQQFGRRREAGAKG
jgi:hypothetical protein